MSYYKLVMKTDERIEYDYVSVKSNEELQKIIDSFSKAFGYKYPLIVTQVSVDDCLSAAEDELHQNAFNWYFTHFLDKNIEQISEYLKMKKLFTEDKNFRWHVLNQYNHYNNRRTEMFDSMMNSLSKRPEIKTFFEGLTDIINEHNSEQEEETDVE